MGRLTHTMARFGSTVDRKAAQTMVPVKLPFTSTEVSEMMRMMATTETLFGREKMESVLFEA
jgi:hypothetical protein